MKIIPHLAISAISPSSLSCKEEEILLIVKETPVT